MANKYLAQEKRVFDISKFTVVGSPTITSDGIASGFSGTAGIKVPPINPNNSSWEVYIEQQVTAEALAYTSSQFVLFTDAGDKGVNIQVRLNDTRKDIFTCQINIPNVGLDYDQLRLNCNSADGNKAVAGDIQGFKLGYDNSTNTYYFKVYKNGVEYASAQSVVEGIINQTTIATLIGYRTNVRGNFSLINLKSYYVKYDNQIIFQLTKPVYLLERRKPKVWNKGQFTIVGNPSISEDGVASGFSGSNYIRVPYRPLGQNFKIFTPRFSSSDASQQQKIVRYSDGNIRIEIYQNKIRLYRYSGSNVYDLPKGETTLQNNTDYYYYVEQTTDGTNYYLKGYISTDNKNWVLDIEKTYTTPMYDRLNNAPIQISGADANQPFIGTLGLKQFKIYTDNTLVFDGGALTYVYDPSKFTVVGSPTVTEYGVASGFNNVNYIEILFVPNSAKFTIKGDFSFGENLHTFQAAFALHSSDIGRYLIELRPVSDNDLAICYYNGTATEVVFYKQTEVPRAVGKTYNFTIEIDGTTAKSTINGITKTISNFVFANTTLLYLGVGQAASNPFKGSINLSQFSITVDGKEIFTGAKENYYMMRKP